MTYHSYHSSNIFYCLAPLIGLVISLNTVLAVIKKLPAGGRKSRLVTYTGFCSLCLLLTLLLSIHMKSSMSKILSSVLFSCFASLPLWNYLLIVEERNRSEIIQLLSLLLIPVLFILPHIVSKTPYVVWLISISVWIFICIRVFNLFRKSFDPGIKYKNFHILITQIFSGLGFFLDFVLIPRWIPFPIFSIAFLVLIVIEISENIITAGEKEFSFEESAFYITPLIVIPLSLTAFWGISMVVQSVKSQEFIRYYRGHITLGTVFLCISLYYPVLTVLKRQIRTIEEHFVDDFTRDLNKILTEEGNIGLDTFSGFLNTYLPDISFQPVMRAPYWSVFNVVYEIREGFRKNSKSIYACSEIIEDFDKQGYSLWTPGNIEKYSSVGDFFKKAVKEIDITDILFIPVYSGTEDNYPLVLFIFKHIKDRVFKILDIKKLYSLVKGIKPIVLEIYNRKFSGKIEFPDNVSQAKSYTELVERMLRGMKKYLPLEKAFLAILTKDWIIRGIFPKPVEWKAEIEGIIGSLPHYRESVKNSSLIKSITKEKFSYLSILIPGAGKYDSLVILICNRKLYHREQNYQEDFQHLTPVLKSALIRINLINELDRQKIHLDKLMLKSEDERRQVAEEIHDTIAQEMYAAKVLIEILEKKITKNSLQSDGDIEILKTTVDEGVKQIRKIINNLRKPGEETVDIISMELVDFIHRQSNESGIQINFENSGILKVLPPGQAKQVALIIREGVNNSLKHSKAGHVRIRLKKKRRFVSLIISDDGEGFKVDERKDHESFGLEGIRAKCNRIAGKLKIRSTPGSGTVLYIRIPFNQD